MMIMLSGPACAASSSCVQVYVLQRGTELARGVMRLFALGGVYNSRGPPAWGMRSKGSFLSCPVLSILLALLLLIVASSHSSVQYS